MTPEEIDLVKESWRRSNPEQLSECFYRKLFNINPQLEDMFLSNMDIQREKFRVTLSFIISHLDAPARLLPKVHELGVLHAGYGVTEEHYDQVQSALLFALRQEAAIDMDSATLAAWRAAYDALANAMRTADLDSMIHP